MLLGKVLQYAAVRWAVGKASAPYDYCKTKNTTFKSSAEKAEAAISQAAGRLSELPALRSADERAAAALASAESFADRLSSLARASLASCDAALGAAAGRALVAVESAVPASAEPAVKRASGYAEAAVVALLPVERVPAQEIPSKPTGVVETLAFHIPAFATLRNRVLGKGVFEIAHEACDSSKTISLNLYHAALARAFDATLAARSSTIAVISYALAIPLAPVIFAARVLGLTLPGMPRPGAATPSVAATEMKRMGTSTEDKKTN